MIWLGLAIAGGAVLAATALVFFLIRRSDLKKTLDERRYALLESLPDALFIVDSNWNFTHVNEAAETLLRRGAAELIGKRIDRILDPFASELLPEMIRAHDLGAPLEFVQTFESTGQAVEVRVQPSDSEILVSLRDVTARRIADKRLRDGERRLRLLLQQVPAVLWTVDLDMFLTSASGTTLADFALREADVVGKRFESVFTSPEDSADAIAALTNVLRGDTVRYETCRNSRWLRHEIEPLRGNDGAIVG
ncbi:MAG TPA: PAS domain-containing protein, partial [Candidatus Acidoferrales bacterium]|nr:PAS domain-containing protein [Candidatus Acidoferrales bacterium]